MDHYKVTDEIRAFSVCFKRNVLIYTPEIAVKHGFRRPWKHYVNESNNKVQLLLDDDGNY